MARCTGNKRLHTDHVAQTGRVVITSTKKLPRRIAHTVRADVRSRCLGAKLEKEGKDVFVPSQYLAFKVG